MAKEALYEMRVSVIFETEALLPPGAPPEWNLPYFNLVVAGETHLSPRALLHHLQQIEKTIGRNREAPRWSPRVIDLDILTWGNQVIDEEDLCIPHPELKNRSFLLNLMASLSPEMAHHVPPFEPISCFVPFPQMVGIVNITPDSFSDGGKYLDPDKAIAHMEHLSQRGAAVLDLGAQSTRPGAALLSPTEEWQRLEPVLKHIQNRPLKTKISLDTFYPEVVEKALHYIPIDWVNDVQGGQNKRLLALVAERKSKIVLNHSLTVPASKTTVLPFDPPPPTQLTNWAHRKMDELQRLGIEPSNIILDPGIGFGKTAFQSLSLLRHIDCLKRTGCEILVGHSRKSFLKTLTKSPDRDLESLGVAAYLAGQGVDYLRVHNVEAHQRILAGKAFVEGLRL
jgi:2-amino-4-hydroxy-6-hydroxymethyldihydropteridine diphosphokinase/dihydropteroate synthase